MLLKNQTILEIFGSLFIRRFRFSDSVGIEISMKIGFLEHEIVREITTIKRDL